jgi:hypothetical protein
MNEEEVKRARQTLNRDAEAGGYHPNPDQEFTLDLMRGLLANEDRYGYRSCPCRMASGSGPGHHLSLRLSGSRPLGVWHVLLRALCIRRRARRQSECGVHS